MGHRQSHSKLRVNLVLFRVADGNFRNQSRPRLPAFARLLQEKAASGGLLPLNPEGLTGDGRRRRCLFAVSTVVVDSRAEIEHRHGGGLVDQLQLFG
jgi:hypothetical protein